MDKNRKNNEDKIMMKTKRPTSFDLVSRVVGSNDYNIEFIFFENTPLYVGNTTDEY